MQSLSKSIRRFINAVEYVCDGQESDKSQQYFDSSILLSSSAKYTGMDPKETLTTTNRFKNDMLEMFNQTVAEWKTTGILPTEEYHKFSGYNLSREIIINIRAGTINRLLQKVRAKQLNSKYMKKIDDEIMSSILATETINMNEMFLFRDFWYKFDHQQRMFIFCFLDFKRSSFGEMDQLWSRLRYGDNAKYELNVVVRRYEVFSEC